MDPKKHPLVEVADLLTNLRPASPGMYLLHVDHHKLCCCNANLATKDAIPIARINSDDINNGLSTKVWNKIEDKIRTLTRQGVLKWQPQKL